MFCGTALCCYTAAVFHLEVAVQQLLTKWFYIYNMCKCVGEVCKACWALSGLKARLACKCVVITIRHIFLQICLFRTVSLNRSSKDATEKDSYFSPGIIAASVKDVLIANGSIHVNLSKKRFNYFAQYSNFKGVFIHSCSTNQLHWGWTLSKHWKRENKIRRMGDFTKREHISVFPLPYMGLSAWPWAPNYVIVEVPLKHYASSYIPRSHRKGCCRCFLCSSLVLNGLHMVSAFSKQSSLSQLQHGSLCKFLITNLSFLSLQTHTHINPPPILKKQVKQQSRLTISASSNSLSKKINFRSTTLLSFLVYWVQTKHRSQTWHWVGTSSVTNGNTTRSQYVRA